MGGPAAPETSRRPSAVRAPWSILAVLLILVGALVAGTWFFFPTAPPVSYAGELRTYFIAADEVEWNYTPALTDGITGLPLTANGTPDALYTQHVGPFLGSTFLKCVYQQYTNASFGTEVVRPANQAYLGILGPVIYAEVGDTIHVTFRNNCRFPESIQPQGLTSPANQSGTPYNGSGTTGGTDGVPPGGTVQYTWTVPPSAGPGAMDGSSILWMYQSGASLLNSSDTGLAGPIVVTAAGMGNANGTPDDVSENLILYENIFNEANSPYLGQNLVDHAPNRTAALQNQSNPAWQQSLLKYAINGYQFGTMPLVRLTAGSSVRWYVMALGNDMHSVQWLGNPVQYDGESTDTVPLLPGVTAVADMTPSALGVWVVQSDDESDLAGGMQARFQVVAPIQGPSSTSIPASQLVIAGVVGAVVAAIGAAAVVRWRKRRDAPPAAAPAVRLSDPAYGPDEVRSLPANVRWRLRGGRSPTGLPALAIGAVVVLTLSACYASGALGSPSSSGTVPYVGQIRQYYIAAEQVEWNYTPSGMDEISGTAFGVSNPGQLQYTTRNATYLGTSFEKCVYRQFTNGSFATPVPQPAWLGIMGPTIYASVGDTIQVEFKNGCEFPESVHPHGVFYNRTDEGAQYNFSGPSYEGEAVPPGDYYNYTWQVPARAGPGPDDGCCVMWMYHSHVYEPVDVNDGLIGSIIITAPGDLGANGLPKGFSEVVPLLFNVFDETQSQYETANVLADALNQSAVNASGIRGCLGLGVDQTCLADPTWGEWAESMRKYTINGYLYGNLPMIYVAAGTDVLWCLMGMGADFHTAWFDGNDLDIDGMTTDVVPLIPAEMVDGTMWANNTGTFLIDSLTQEDLNGGMEARYTVLPASDAVPALGAPSAGSPA